MFLEKGKNKEKLAKRLADKASRAYELKMQKEVIETELSEINALLIEELGGGVKIVGEDFYANLIITERLSIDKEQELRKILGERFDDLVSTKISYFLTPKLKEIVQKDASVAATIKSKYSNSITYKAK